MSMSSYKDRRGNTRWAVEFYVQTRTGEKRVRKRGIPTREQAKAWIAKQTAAAFEDREFDRRKMSRLSVKQAWDHWSPVSKRDNDSWKTDKGRAAHLCRHLGDRQCATLSRQDVEAYRTRRLEEKTKRGDKPAPATLDREVALLKRILSYAVECGRLEVNPLAGLPLLNKPNVRRTTITDEQFEALLPHLPEWMRPVMLVAYDTGMRIGEVLHLTWRQLDAERGTVTLAPQDTKAEEPRLVVLQARTLAALEAVPRVLRSQFVFANPKTRRPRTQPRRGFKAACAAAGLPDLWVHDLRRSFVTKARRLGVPESVVMRMSGHRTRAVFDRYNIVSEEDLRAAVRTLEQATNPAAKNTATEEE